MLAKSEKKTGDIGLYTPFSLHGITRGNPHLGKRPYPWITVHYLVHPTKVLKYFKFSPLISVP